MKLQKTRYISAIIYVLVILILKLTSNATQEGQHLQFFNFTILRLEFDAEQISLSTSVSQVVITFTIHLNGLDRIWTKASPHVLEFVWLLSDASFVICCMRAWTSRLDE